MVINKEGMPVPEEKSETTKLMDCIENVRHESFHRGDGFHRHHHSSYESYEQGENHHGEGGRHYGYTPNKNDGFYKEHSHPHTHEGEGDPLAVLDIGANEIVVAENVSLNSYSEDLFFDLGSGF